MREQIPTGPFLSLLVVVLGVFFVFVAVCFWVVLFDQGLEWGLVASSDVLESLIKSFGISQFEY